MKNVSEFIAKTLRLVSAICALWILASASYAATFTVTNTNNSGAGSLRQAIINANIAAGADTVNFDTAGVFADPQTITLTGGTLMMYGELTIAGPGADRLTISGNHAGAVFYINFDSDMTIDGLTIADGNNQAWGGGGVWSDGNLTLMNSVVTGNSAVLPGGGIYGGENTILTITNSVISNNHSNRTGGGITNGGSLFLSNSTVSGNTAGTAGGGIHNQRCRQLVVTNSTISGNSATNFGGGIVVSGSLTYFAVTGSTISGNSSNEGGGVLALSTAPLTFTSTTITDNRASVSGGGLSTTGEFILNSTIVAGNFVAAAPGDIDAPLVAATNTLVGDASSAAGVVNGVDGNIVGANPMLGPLADNGGRMKTHALRAGSPAIDTGANAASLATDQRGYQRKNDFAAISNGVGDGSDIGAFELDPDTDADGVRDFTDNCTSTPNPEKIAFSSSRDGNFEIYVMNADGSNPTRLTNNPTFDQMPEFSHDGSKIVFYSDRDGNGEIYVMNSDGTGQVNLTNDPAEDSYPTFSPDGSKVAFTSLRNGKYDVYVMNVDGTGQTNLTNDAGTNGLPSFSPDGSKIAFMSVRDGNREIYVMNSDGTVQTNLTNNPADDLEPKFSPDGSKIAFYSFRDGNYEVYVMNADGSGQTNLSNNAAQDQEPAFSPDGSKIVYYSLSAFRYEVYAMNSDGTNQTNLTNNTPIDFQPSWGPQLDGDRDGVGDACENSAPIANAESYSVQEDELLNGASVLGNDTDGENNNLTAVWVSDPVNSQAFSLNPDGTFTYTPNANYYGIDFFTYKANDGLLDSEVVTVTITVVPANDAPTISPSTISRQQAAGSSNSMIATVADIDSPIGDLFVTVNGGVAANITGVWVSNISIDGSGNVMADVSAACGASSAMFSLSVNDGSRFSFATLNVNVTNETTAPVINPISNVTAYLPLNSPASSMAVTFPLPTATDNCSATTVTTLPASGSVFSIGTTTVNVTAKDTLNNTSTATFTVKVLYNFGGFLQPVDPMPVLNIGQAGSSIPVKFSLSGNKGLGILAAGYPMAAPIACDQNEPGSLVEETDNAGGSVLTYDALADQYKYVWKTNKSWKGTCWMLVVRLTDGSDHYAKFRFK